MMGRRCKLVGCRAELTDRTKLYCSVHEYRKGDRYEISERDVGRKPKR